MRQTSVEATTDSASLDLEEQRAIKACGAREPPECTTVKLSDSNAYPPTPELTVQLIAETSRSQQRRVAKGRTDEAALQENGITQSTSFVKN